MNKALPLRATAMGILFQPRFQGANRRGQEPVPSAQAANDLLLDLAALPVGADDLQILVSGPFNDTTFNPDEHARIMAINLNHCQVISGSIMHIVGHYICQLLTTAT